MIERDRMRLERLFVWLGGAVFVASLALTGYVYVIVWARARPFDAGAAWPALGANALLVAAFAGHHSLCARDGAKEWLARRIPVRLLRSVYVWIASLLWTVVVWGWQPVGGALVHHTGAAAIAHAVIQLAGVLLIVRSVRAIDPLELAGIRHGLPAGGLQTRGPYRIVRHPLYLGWVLIVFGAAHLTGDRLAFAGVTTVYLMVAIPWEERALERAFGDAYRQYTQTVRWRMIPYVY